MKKLTFYLILGLIISSCKKGDDLKNNVKQSDQKKYEVKIAASDFAQQVSAISKKKGAGILSVPVGDAVTYQLAYLVYDATGKEVSEVRQYKSGLTRRAVLDEDLGLSYLANSYGTTFGSIRDSLPAGHYTVVMIASGLFAINSIIDQEFNLVPFNDAFFQWVHNSMSPSRSVDTFFKKFTIDVTAQGVNQEIALERIVGKVQLNILDGNSGSGTYRILIEKDHERFQFANEQSSAETMDFEDSQEGYKEGTFGGPAPEFFILNTNSTINVTIIYDRFGVKTYKVIENVPIYKNKRTVVSGNLFSIQEADSKLGFSVKVNDQWDEPVEVEF